MRNRHRPSVRSLAFAASAAAIAIISIVTSVLAGSGGGPFPK